MYYFPQGFRPFLNMQVLETTRPYICLIGGSSFSCKSKTLMMIVMIITSWWGGRITFHGMVDQPKAHVPYFNPGALPETFKITNLRQATSRFELTQNLSSGFVKWGSAVVITSTPWHHFKKMILKIEPNSPGFVLSELL